MAAGAVVPQMLGPLREGDAHGDNYATILDFSLLRLNFGRGGATCP